MRKKVKLSKELIGEVTARLLNKQGLSNVTMRDVSSELGISIGNLTYHFPKWDDIIDFIFADFLTQLNNLYHYFPKDLSQVVEYIGHIYDMQMRYAFIFSNYYLFFEMYPKYNPLKTSFFSERMSIMSNAFVRLEQKKLLYCSSVEHNYDILVKNAWIILSGWYGFSKMFDDVTYAVSKENFLFSLWNLCFPHLTEEGKNIVVKSYREYKKKTSSEK